MDAQRAGITKVKRRVFTSGGLHKEVLVLPHHTAVQFVRCCGFCLQLALSIRMKVFGGNNLFVAIACEDLAYATYVFEYSSGKFADAR